MGPPHWDDSNICTECASEEKAEDWRYSQEHPIGYFLKYHLLWMIGIGAIIVACLQGIWHALGGS